MKKICYSNSFLTEKYCAYLIIGSLYKRLDYKIFIKRLEWQAKNGATRELQKASARTLRILNLN